MDTQAVGQNNGAISNYDQELPVGGDDLLAAGANPQAQTPLSMPLNDPANTGQPQYSQAPADPVGGSDDLIEIKKDALQQLTPLVGHLDQTPDEKFRTTMMLIQATDDKSLLKTAYQSALQIADEKSRAQALLDVVNEINYFTHPDVQ